MHAQPMVEDLSPAVFTLHEEAGYQITPYQRQGSRVRINLVKYQGLQLAVSGPKGSTIFTGSVKIGELGNDGRWQKNIDSLQNFVHQDTEILLSLVANTTEGLPWQVHILEPPTHPIATDDTQQYQKNRTRDVLVIAWFLMCAALLTAYYSIPRIFEEYFTFSSVFSSLQREEAAMKVSILGRPYLGMSFIYGLAYATLFLLLALHQPGFQKLFSVVEGPTPWLSWFVCWVLWALFLMVAFGFRWILIGIVSEPFGLGGIRKLQFFNYLRIAIYLGLPLSFLLLSAAIVQKEVAGWLTQTISILVPIIVSVRLILIFLKTRRQSTLRYVHLISYLCATEIVPMAIFLKFFYSI